MQKYTTFSHLLTRSYTDVYTYSSVPIFYLISLDRQNISLSTIFPLNKVYMIIVSMTIYFWSNQPLNTAIEITVFKLPDVLSKFSSMLVFDMFKVTNMITEIFFKSCFWCTLVKFMVIICGNICTVIMLGVKHSPSKGQLSLFLQLQPNDVCFGFKIFLLWVDNIELILFKQL